MRRIVRPAANILVALVMLVVIIPLHSSSAQGGAVSCDSQVSGTIGGAAWFEDWTLSLKAEQSVTLTMEQASGDLDPYLYLLNLDGSVLNENDDAESGTMGFNSQIIATLPAGRYTVRASRYEQQTGTSTGSYSLSLACGAPGQSSGAGTSSAGGVLFSEDFSMGPGSWEVGTSDNGEVWVEEGALHILNYTTAEFTTHSSAGQAFADFVLTMDVTLVDGAIDNWHYITFRSQGAADQYRVGFSADGYYMGEARYGDVIVEEWAIPTQSGAIRQGIGETNVVRVEMIRDHVKFYVNNELLVDHVVAPQYLLASGDISLAVASMNGADFSEVAFDNVVVADPSAAGSATVELIFADDFSDNSNNWELWADKSGEVGLYDGHLVIRDHYDDIAISAFSGVWLENFTLEVDVQLLDGTPVNWIFVVFRWDENDNYYRVGISSDGYYVGSEHVNGELTAWMEPAQTNAIIQEPNAVNAMRLEMAGSNVRLFVNDIMVFDVVPFTPLPLGEIALSADALEEQMTTIAFDNLRITVP